MGELIYMLYGVFMVMMLSATILIVGTLIAVILREIISVVINWFNRKF